MAMPSLKDWVVSLVTEHIPLEILRGRTVMYPTIARWRSGKTRHDRPYQGLAARLFARAIPMPTVVALPKELPAPEP